MSQPFKDADGEEDFNLFVSPSRYSGRTPNAATAKSRVFQDAAKMKAQFEKEEEGNANNNVTRRPKQPPKQRQEQPRPKQNEVPQEGLDRVIPIVPHLDLESADPATNIVSQSRVRHRVACVNWLAAGVGFALLLCASWVCLREFEAALVAVLINHMPLFHTPLLLGAALAVGAVSMVLYGAVLGAGSLAKAISAGFVTRTYRTSLIIYESLIFLSLVAFSLTLVSSSVGLLSFKGLKTVREVTWNSLPPVDRCNFELYNNCVGFYRGSCTNSSGNNIAQCGGLFCQTQCTLLNNPGACKTCGKRLTGELLKQCADHELHTNSIYGCGSALLRRSRIVLVLAFAASVLGLTTGLSVGVVDLLSTS